jgi:hypothetical protein
VFQSRVSFYTRNATSLEFLCIIHSRVRSHLSHFSLDLFHCYVGYCPKNLKNATFRELAEFPPADEWWACDYPTSLIFERSYVSLQPLPVILKRMAIRIYQYNDSTLPEDRVRAICSCVSNILKLMDTIKGCIHFSIREV